jgi:hypothetical protein
MSFVTVANPATNIGGQTTTNAVSFKAPSQPSVPVVVDPNVKPSWLSDAQWSLYKSGDLVSDGNLGYKPNPDKYQDDGSGTGKFKYKADYKYIEFPNASEVMKHYKFSENDVKKFISEASNQPTNLWDSTRKHYSDSGNKAVTELLDNYSRYDTEMNHGRHELGGLSVMDVIGIATLPIGFEGAIASRAASAARVGEGLLFGEASRAGEVASNVGMRYVSNPMHGLNIADDAFRLNVPLGRLGETSRANVGDVAQLERIYGPEANSVKFERNPMHGDLYYADMYPQSRPFSFRNPMMVESSEAEMLMMNAQDDALDLFSHPAVYDDVINGRNLAVAEEHALEPLSWGGYGLRGGGGAIDMSFAAEEPVGLMQNIQRYREPLTRVVGGAPIAMGLRMAANEGADTLMRGVGYGGGLGYIGDKLAKPSKAVRQETFHMSDYDYDFPGLYSSKPPVVTKLPVYEELKTRKRKSVDGFTGWVLMKNNDGSKNALVEDDDNVVPDWLFKLRERS